MSIGERIIKVRGGLTREEFAKRLGVNKSSVQRWETENQVPTGTAIIRLIEEFGIDANWLLLDDSDKAQSLSTENNKLGDFSLVPMAETHLSAGGGAFIMSEELGTPHAFRRDWLRRAASRPNNIIMMVIDGDSMFPSIQNGDAVLVDTGRTRVTDNKIYALGLGETISIKRLDMLPGGNIRIRSDNPNYEPYNARLDEIRILGQVIWFARELF